MSETTLVALRTDTSQRVAIGDHSAELLRRLSDQHLLACPQCHSPLVFKGGAVRIHHFAHISLADCTWADHENETDSHREGKLRLYQHFRQGARTATLEQHFRATDQRADVYVEAADARRYALEFQQASQSALRWNERRRLYRSLGVIDLWFLGQVRYQERLSSPLTSISPYDPLPVPRHEFEAASGVWQVRELEKAICAAEHELYYLDPETGLVTLLLARDVRGNTLRGYRYRFLLAACSLHAGRLVTPLDPLLVEYRQARHQQR